MANEAKKFDFNHPLVSLLDSLIFKHPLPWTVCHDGEGVVIASGETRLVNCSGLEEANYIVEFAEEREKLFKEMRKAQEGYLRSLQRAVSPQTQIRRQVKTLRAKSKKVKSQSEKAERESQKIDIQIKAVQAQCPHKDTVQIPEQDCAEMKLRTYCKDCGAQC